MSQDHESPLGDDAPDPTPAPVGPPRGTARALLLVAGAVVAVEGGGLVALAALEVASIQGERVGLGVSTAVFLGGLGLLLLVAVGAILRGHAWARGLLVFSQFLCLVLSFNFRGDAGWITPTMAGASLLALACLLSPPVTRALGGRDPV